MNILIVSESHENLNRLIGRILASSQPIVIFRKFNRAVFLSFKYWDVTQESLFLLSVPIMCESIKSGMTEPLANSAKELGW
jgi:PHD/YefM family antitoxin component YafN of YafNO toxin-antitoxin module